MSDTLTEDRNLTNPSVVIQIADSYMTKTESNEIIETVVTQGPDGARPGQPDWNDAGICDARGSGGEEGYRSLRLAVELAEENAERMGVEVRRIPE
jgi:hypothetical protein